MANSARQPWLGAFGWRLFLSLALLSLLMVGAVGTLGYSQARRALMAEARSHMESVARERRARLEAWFEERLTDITLLSEFLVQNGVAESGRSGAIERNLAIELGSETAYSRLIVLGPDGDILAALGERGEPDGLRRSVEVAAAIEHREAVLGSVSLDPDGDPVMRLAAPLLDEGEVLGAVLAILRPGSTMQPILADSTGLGLTGETYLVDEATVMLTPSRHMNHPPALTHKMPTPGVLRCLELGSGSEIYTGYLGEEVLGAFEWLPRQRWVLLAEIQTREAFAPLRAIARQTLLLGCLALVVALLLSITLSRRLSRPIGELAAASERVAAGALEPPARITGPGEIGRLAGRFEEMVASLARSRIELEASSHRLLQAERLAAVGQLAAGLVHEMRNPLSAMKMSLSGLARNSKLNATEQEQLQIAREQGERLERMLDELLDYSRPVELRQGSIDLAALAGVVEQSTGAERVDAGVQLLLEIQHELPPLVADGEILVRVLVNLVNNAVQASKRGDAVRLTVQLKEEGVEFAVSDVGCGMSPQVLERLFDPFFTAREGGIGLGMSNVRKFVDLHGGELAIASDTGEGTRVAILIPEGQVPSQGSEDA